ncbi:MAG: hypothetical protein RSA70_05500, partial [Clostridia bacterium]
NLTNECENITNRFKSAKNIEITAAIEAEFPDRTSKYRVQLSYRDSGSTLKVLEPASIAGITAKIVPGETTPSFDGDVLITGFENAEITPLNVLPTLIDAWRSGTQNSYEGGTRAGIAAIMVEHVRGDVKTRTWFSKSDAHPLFAEIIERNACVMRVNFEKVELK